MRRYLAGLLTLALLLIGTNAALSRQGISSEELERRADTLRPTAEEKLWQQIPWYASLIKAQEVAKAEKRPLFVWTDDNDPFQRC